MAFMVTLRKHAEHSMQSTFTLSCSTQAYTLPGTGAEAYTPEVVDIKQKENERLVIG